MLLTSPFRNFLHLEDLEEADPLKPRTRPPPWKTRVLAALPLLEAIGHVSAFAYDESLSKHDDGARAVAVGVGWVSVPMRHMP